MGGGGKGKIPTFSRFAFTAAALSPVSGLIDWHVPSPLFLGARVLCGKLSQKRPRWGQCRRCCCYLSAVSSPAPPLLGSDGGHPPCPGASTALPQPKKPRHECPTTSLRNQGHDTGRGGVTPRMCQPFSAAVNLFRALPPM